LKEELKTIHDGDPVRGVMMARKNTITRVSALMILSMSAENLKDTRKRTDMEEINLIRNGLESGPEIMDQVQKAVGKISPVEPDGKKLEMRKDLEKSGVEFELFERSKSFLELFPKSTSKMMGIYRCLSPEEENEKPKEECELDARPANPV
jgi:hypothetical protein